MRALFYIFFIITCITAEAQTTADEQQLIRADRAFSQLSRQKGMRYAFLQYMDSASVLLRKNQFPLVGPQARAMIESVKDSSFSLSWEPSAAFIARSGELGYTYGIYTTTTKDTSLNGTYVTIWRRQKNGNWKFVLDTGNEGVGK